MANPHRGKLLRGTKLTMNDDPKPDAILKVENVRKSFRGGLLGSRRRVPVLVGASMNVRAGELVGLVGENGSGKSTLLQIIVGMIDRDGGTVERPKTLGYCPQVPLLWGKMTPVEHFRLFGAAYGMSEGDIEDSSRSLMAELRFERYATYLVEDLSGGTRQKLNLALALMHSPRLLLLDEPYAGFDWETYLRFWEMSESRRDRGMGVLIVSHLLGERERLDRIYELREGRCVEV